MSGLSGLQRAYIQRVLWFDAPIVTGDKMIARARMKLRCSVLVLVAFGCMNAQKSAEAEFDQAMQLAAKGDFAAAETSLRGLAKAHPDVFGVRYRLALVLLRQGKAEEAASELGAAVKIDPSSALAWVSLANARLRLKQDAPAMAAAERASQLAAKDPQAHKALAMFYLEAGKAYRASKEPAKAVNAFQSALHANPDQPDAYFELATLFLDHRTPKPAVAVLESAVSRFPREPEFRRLLGLAHYHTGEVQKAITAFLAAVDIDPDAEAGYASFETLLPDAGPSLSEIIARLTSFRKRKPTSPVGHFLFARALSAAGSPAAEVEPLLRAAIEADAAFWPAHYELGQLLEKQGKHAEALRALLTAEKLKPDYAPVHFSLSRLYTSTGDRARALEHRKKHHELQAREREATARARAAAPTLSYRMESPKGR